MNEYKDKNIEYTFSKKYLLPEVEGVLSKEEPRQINLMYKVCNDITSKTPAMIELGAAEGYYSYVFYNFFNKSSIKCKNICIEPVPHKLDILKENLKEAKTYNGYFGTWDVNDGDFLNITKDNNQNISKIKKLTLEEILNDNIIESYDILHVDIQGGELEVFKEIQSKNLFSKFKNAFISTHDQIIPNIHNDVVEILKSIDYIDIQINESQSNQGYGYGDGFIYYKLKRRK